MLIIWQNAKNGAVVARLYPKVLAFWEEAHEGTATHEQDGKKFLNTTRRSLRAGLLVLFGISRWESLRPQNGR
jgi:hypothetical protein